MVVNNAQELLKRQKEDRAAFVDGEEKDEMAIREKLGHAMRYGYPVRVELPNGCIDSCEVKEIDGNTCRLLQARVVGLTCCHIPIIVSVKPVSEITEEATAQISPGMKVLIKSFTDTKEKLEEAAIRMGKEMLQFLLNRAEPSEDCDDTPDSEIAEIGRDEKWESGSGDEPRWAVYALRCSDRGKLESYRCVSQFTEEKDAKAAATLPDLVRQRDKLLEAAKAGVCKGSGSEFLELIAEIERNPLIRLTDPE